MRYVGAHRCLLRLDVIQLIWEGLLDEWLHLILVGLLQMNLPACGGCGLAGTRTGRLLIECEVAGLGCAHVCDRRLHRLQTLRTSRESLWLHISLAGALVTRERQPQAVVTSEAMVSIFPKHISHLCNQRLRASISHCSKVSICSMQASSGC